VRIPGRVLIDVDRVGRTHFPQQYGGCYRGASGKLVVLLVHGPITPDEMLQNILGATDCDPVDIESRRVRLSLVSLEALADIGAREADREGFATLYVDVEANRVVLGVEDPSRAWVASLKEQWADCGLAIHRERVEPAG
jgi:hypothetical protein